MKRAIIALILAMCIVIPACVYRANARAVELPTDPRTQAKVIERLTEADRIAYTKCGPEGTVDWDDNPSYPPPHCNRNGWNGHEYEEPKE